MTSHDVRVDTILRLGKVALNHASGMKRSITAAGRGQQRTTVGKASRPASLVRADGANNASQLSIG